MNRDMVMQVLDKFSDELPYYFDLDDSEDASYSGSGSSGDERARNRRRDGAISTSSGSKPRAIKLTVHGGACMLLHPGFHSLSLKMPEIPRPKLSTNHSPSDPSRLHDPTYVGPRPTKTIHDLARRTSTRDVDIVLRGFVADFGALGPPPRNKQRRREGGWAGPEEDVSRMDAATRLKACIKATTRYFPGLGLDWMNADADVSLPMAAHPTTLQTYDPIHTSTWTYKNTHLYTVYTSPNKRLVLTSVPPYWLLALKMSRWGPRDWADVGIVLRYGTLMSRTLVGQDIEWSGDRVRKFLEKECWAMGYLTDRYDVGKKRRVSEKV
ncbi:hypothetical protein CPB84DRAFT_236638 [Gymnopilus junonius]|uniref:Uncharacterized protein n=1 Tax=Gymnopilus junonius TaxID=109634 RepID=A0A9P5NCA9_GYMJU|nr:hypothetical protein CPB84DRAFT_236638 [Gymnopilus junonius]